MSLYISINALSDNFKLAKILEIYHQNQINKIELSSWPHYELKILNALKIYPASYLVHNYFPAPKKPFVFNLASSNPKIVQKSLKLAKKAIKLCKLIHSPFYSFHGGLLFDSEGQLEAKTKTFKINSKIYDKKQARQTFLSNLEKLLLFAQKMKVRLLIENNVCTPLLKNKLLFVDEEDFLWLFSKIENKNVGILLDLGHLKVSAQTYGFKAEKFISKVKGKIQALHLHDNDGKNDLHWPLTYQSWSWQLLKSLKLKCHNLSLILEARLQNIQEILQQKKLVENL